MTSIGGTPVITSGTDRAVSEKKGDRYPSFDGERP